VKYDLIIMCDILEHLPHDFSALEHARTVLAANGHIFLSIPYAHDLERTHVRAYSYVTLSRLLALAGYEIVWKRERPGALESTPLTTLTNYALASLMPSVDLGARALHFLLRAEFAVNERTRGLYARLGRSPQRGIILAARAAPVPAKDHVLMNREDFIPEAATRHN
jgi:hypothetical protein